MRSNYRGIFLGILALVIGGMLLFCGQMFFLKKAYPIEYHEYVQASAEKFDVEQALIFAVIKCESNFRQDAQSNVGAIGLMQVMPDTFDWLQSHKLMPYMDVGSLKNPQTNIEYGTYLLSLLQRKYGTLVETICAYNAGFGAVDKWLKDERYSSDGKTLKNIPYKATALYVKNVLQSRKMYKNLYFKNT